MSGNLYCVDVLHLLDADATALLSQWSEAFELGKDTQVSHDALVEAFRQRQSLSRLLKYVREDLRDEDISMFPFLLPHQKIHLRQRLVRAHYLTSIQARIDEIEYRWDGLLANQAQCARYASLIRALDAPFYAKDQEGEQQLYQLIDDSEKPLAWFGARVLTPILSDTMVELCAGNTAAIKNLMIEIDRKDVYLGWSRSFILSFFGLFPECFSGNAEHLQSLRDAGILLTYTNIVIVNAGLIMECYLVLKNTFSGAMATRHAHLHVDVSEQFLTQIRQRRFVLLNWLLLSFLHVAAFLCFSGFIDVWPWGPFFGVGCRLAQIVLASARYRDEETTYYASSKRILDQINALNDLEKHLLYEISHAKDEDEKARLLSKLKLISEDRQSLQYAYQRMKNDWMIKKDEFAQHSMLSSLFFAGVMMFSCLLIPTTILAPPIGLAIGFSGAAICIIFVVAMSVMRTNFANERIRQDILHIHQPVGYRIKTVPDEQLNVYMRRFVELKGLSDHPKHTLEMKQCYLRMRQLVNRSHTQMQVLEYQKVNLWLTVARDVLLPLIALSMLVFIPTPVGLGAIVGLILLHFLAKKIFQTYRPVVNYSLNFDEKAYQKFAASPSVESLIHIDSRLKNNTKFHNSKTNDDGIDDFTSDFSGMDISP